MMLWIWSHRDIKKISSGKLCGDVLTLPLPDLPKKNSEKQIASLVWVAFPRNASILCAYSASRTDVSQPVESTTKLLLTALVNMKFTI